MMLIKYLNLQNEVSIVKILLGKYHKYLEFEVFLARLEVVQDIKGKEVTINWRNIKMKSHGIFYTDANAFKMVKREARLAEKLTVPSNFYPVNSGIYVEDG